MRLTIDLRWRQRWESAAAAFLAGELQTAHTSVELAATSHNEENKLTYCRHAWTAYDAVVRLCHRVPLQEDERSQIEERLAVLKANIEAVVPWAQLARRGGDGRRTQPSIPWSEPQWARWQATVIGPGRIPRKQKNRRKLL
jgi:predicted P-loop ATPase